MHQKKEKIYALIKSNETYHFCLETSCEYDSASGQIISFTVFLDRIMCFPCGKIYKMERLKFDKLKREGMLRSAGKDGRK